MEKLILIDDHAMLREGIAFWLSKNSDWKISAQAGTVKEFEDLLKSLPDDNENITIAIVDLSFKTESNEHEKNYGFEIIKELAKKNVKSVVFSSHDSGWYVEKAMSDKIGAKGYVSKSSDERTLLDAINTVANGKTYIQPDLIKGLLDMKNFLSVLTKKELEVVEMISLKLTNIEIAERMEINVRTVENYLSRLYDKTGTVDRATLLAKIGKI